MAGVKRWTESTAKKAPQEAASARGGRVDRFI